jgi:gas vesicle protein
MSKSNSKVLFAGIVGLAAGVAIGMLFAPAKGSKTRKRLKKRFMGIADSLQDDFSSKIGALKSVFSGEQEEDEEEDEALSPGEPVKPEKHDA